MNADDVASFNDALRRCGVKESSLAFCRAAVDPFCDTVIPVSGVPDAEIGRSVVYDIRKQVTIDSPGLPAGSTWDLHIATLPMVSGINYMPGRSQNGSIVTYGQLQSPFELNQMVAYQAVATGDHTFTLQTPAVGYTGGLGVDQMTDENIGPGRLVSLGWEVHNTTADLYNQGSCTVYSAPGSTPVNGTWSAYNEQAGQFTGNGLITTALKGPPTNATLALRMGGITYEAKEGAYCVPHINYTADTPKRPTRADPVWWLDEYSQHQTNAAVSQYFETFEPHQGTVTNVTPMSRPGAYFTGLHENASLTLIMRARYEVYPYGDTDAVSLASPSCPYDPIAFKCIADLMNDKPAGVMVRFNDRGDWFRGIVKALREMADVAVPMLMSNPTTAPFGEALGAGMVTADAFEKALKGVKKRPKKKAAKKTPNKAA